MPWYAYLLQFLSGALLTNSVPHYVQGVCGHRFQSPFAKPPGVGESSPRVNVLWGAANGVGGALLLHAFWPTNALGWTLFAVGNVALAVMLAGHFGRVRAANGSAPTAQRSIA